ncbi:hypothetical protein B1218_30490, partial [Pseudomonas ogarae]
MVLGQLPHRCRPTQRDLCLTVTHQPRPPHGSARRAGRSRGERVREGMGGIPVTIALFGCFLLMIIVLAVLALSVVKAMAERQWGICTVMAPIPIAMFMGIYMRYIRPGR